MSSLAPWADLPRELLLLIANRLADVDLLQLRAVCKPWRSSIPLQISQPPFPLKLPFPISPNDPIHPKRRGFFSLSSTTIYLLEPLDRSGEAPYQAMLIRVKTGAKGKLQVVNPFSGEKPIGFSPKTFPKVLNLLDYRVTEVSKSYGMQFMNRPGNEAPRFTYQHKDEFDAVQISRVVVSPTSGENGYVIFGIYNAGKLFFMRAGDKKWRTIDDGPNPCTRYEDVAVHNGKCYAVANSGTITAFNTSSSKDVDTIPSPATSDSGTITAFNTSSSKDVDTIPSPATSDSGTITASNPFSSRDVDTIPSPVTSDTGRKYLVESMGDLYLVYGDLDPPPELGPYWLLFFNMESKTYSGDRDIHYKLRFKVYKLNEKLGSWDEVKRLEDRAIFLGEACRFSVPAKGIAGCRGNCIYYEDQWRILNLFDDQKTYDASLRGIQYQDIGLFKFEDGSGAPIVCSPGYIDIFWPPPAWISPDPSSDHDEEPLIEQDPIDINSISLYLA